MIVSLIPHEASPPGPATAVTVSIGRNLHSLTLTYRLEGQVDAILVPGAAPPTRTDNLWHHTCFEAFLGLIDGSYREYNFSPSGAWAAYHFDGYRLGMKDMASPDMDLVVTRDDSLTLRVTVPLEADLPVQLGLSTIVETIDGTKSFWAVAHPPGPPEFHHPACRAIELAPAI